MMIVPREEGSPQPDTVDLTTVLARPREGGDGVHVVGTRGAVHISRTRGQHERSRLLKVPSA